MIKRMSLKKITIAILAMITVFLFYIFPTNEKLEIKEEIEYVSDDNISAIYLMDTNNYVSLTSVNIDNKDITKKARDLLLCLIKGEKFEDIIPSGFVSPIPSDTSILNIEYKNNTIKVDFSKELMNTNEDMEEKIIESIVYTLTSIDDIKYVIIYMEGKLLNILPKSKINLPSTLDRNYGINKIYNVSNIENISKTTIYYVSKNNGLEYYIPVTKIDNNKKEKANIIVEDLCNSITNKKLMSYLNSNTKINNVSIDNDVITVDFNESIYSNNETLEVLEEVTNSLSMSFLDNYDVKSVILTVNDKEIYKSS